MAARKSTEKKKAAPAKDPEAIRKKVLADPNTAEIAKNIGVPLKEYVDQVVHYAMNPTEDASVYLVEDGDLEAMGLPPPDEDEMGKYLIDAAKVAEASGATAFDGPAKKASVSLQSLGKVVEKTDEKLKADLEKDLKSKRSRKG